MKILTIILVSLQSILVPSRINRAKVIKPSENLPLVSTKAAVDSICYHTIWQDFVVSYWPYCTLEVATRFTATQYPVRIDSVGIFFYVNNVFPSAPDTIRVYTDNSGLPGTLLTEQTFYVSVSSGGVYYCRVPFDIPPQVNSGDFWISYTSCVTGTDSLFVCSDTTPTLDSTRNAYNYQNSGWVLESSDMYDWGIIAFVTYLTAGVPDIACSPNPLYVDVSKSVKSTPVNKFEETVILPVIEPALMEEIEKKPDEFIPVTISMKRKYNKEYLKTLLSGMPKKEKRKLLVSMLKELAEEQQRDLLNYLKGLEKEGKARNIVSLWINNSISVELKPEEILKISKREDIGYIFEEKKLQLCGAESPSAPEKLLTFTTSVQDKAIVWNVTAIDADDVWTLGYTGQGILVAHLDTGVNYNHLDLADHMWDGGTEYPYHGYDFGDNDYDPIDVNGHGTHTAGTIAGDGTAGTQTGVAPDAIIMALKIFPDTGGGTNTMIGEAVQFAIEHGADLLSMSAGVPNPDAYIKDWSRQTANNLYVADIPWIVAAGNGDINDTEGDGDYHYTVPQDIYSPADVPPPWNPRNGNGVYGGGENSVIAVGAVNQDSTWASFSSYGPTEWNTLNYNDYPYPPGLLKPDLMAPGGAPGITSLDYSLNDGYISGWEGTSMACPHVAGIVALMLQKNPLLSVAQIDSILETTACDLGVSGKDSLFGSGLVNALAAVNATPSPTLYLTATFYVKNEGSDTLNVSGIEKHRGWITNVIPSVFSVAPGDSQEVIVVIDTTAPTTILEDTLLIYSNDPDENPYPERVILVSTPVGEEYSSSNSETPLNAIYVYPVVTYDDRKIKFTVPESEVTVIELFDIQGRKLGTLKEEYLTRGTHELTLPRDLRRGIYFLRIEQRRFSHTARIVVI